MNIPQIISQALDDADIAAASIQAFNEGYIYGSVDLGAFVDSTGLLNLQAEELRLLSTQVGGPGAGLGFGGNLTLAETNMTQPGTIDSKRAVIVRGYGVVIDGFPVYDDASVLLGWNPLVLQRLSQSFVLRMVLGTRNSYVAGPLDIMPAGQFGVKGSGSSVAGCCDNEDGFSGGYMLSNARVPGEMMRFSTAESLVAVGPNGSLQMNITQHRPVYLTTDGLPWIDGESENHKIKSAKLRVVLPVFDIAGMAN